MKRSRPARSGLSLHLCRRVALSLLIGLLPVAGPVWAATYLVTGGADGVDSCTEVAPDQLECETLRAAIDAASSPADPDHIVFADDVDAVALEQGELVIPAGKNLTITTARQA